MKAVMLSIQPKFCELIASGKKTVEVRRTKPKIDVPFKCYIYCTKGDWLTSVNGKVQKPNNMVIDLSVDSKIEKLNGKVIGEFVCDRAFSMSIFCSDINSPVESNIFPSTCLTDRQIIDYLGNGGEGYGWHISDLVIYDKPKELSEFFRHDNTYDNCFGWAFEDKEKSVPITRPPQSWCYVEELKG